MPLNFDYNYNQKVSSALALVFVALLSTLLAWVTVIKAREVATDVKASAIIDINKRIERNH